MAQQIRIQYFVGTGQQLQRDCLIGILGTRCSIEAILLSIAVCFSGAAYIPIDVANNPPLRIKAMLKEANVQFCIGSSDSFNPLFKTTDESLANINPDKDGWERKHKIFFNWNIIRL